MRRQLSGQRIQIPARQQFSLFLRTTPRRTRGGVIDIDNHKEYLIGNDIDIEDIVWFGAVDKRGRPRRKAAWKHSAPMNRLEELVTQARTQGRKIHFPASLPSRPDDSTHGPDRHTSFTATRGSIVGTHHGGHRPTG